MAQQRITTLANEVLLQLPNFTRITKIDVEVLVGAATNPSISLYPTGDNSVTDIVNELDAASPLFSSVDDDPDSPNDSDWINNTDANGEVFFDLTDMPASFASAVTADILIRVRGVNYGATPMEIQATLMDTDETTAYSDTVVVSTVSADSSFANESVSSFTLNATGLAASKTDWDNAKIRLVWAVV